MTLLDANRPVEGPKQAGTNFASKTTLNPGNDVDQNPFVLSEEIEKLGDLNATL